MLHQERNEPQSHGHWIKLLKWPVVFWLAFTSFPAGFMPFFAAGAYRGMQHEQHVSPKWRIPARIESGRHMLYIALLFSVGAGIVHAAMVFLSWRKWNGILLGLRGAGWFAMAWSAFGVGMAMGIWIYTVAPE
jgi:hypothetical protein